MRKSRSIFILVGVLIIFVAGLWVGNRLPSFPGLGSSKRVYNSSTLLQEVRTLSQLVTVQYVIEKVVVLEDVKWYGENRVMLLAHGIVKAGIDLGQMATNDIAVETNKVILRLPPAQIVDCYLDDSLTQVIDRTTGLWRSPDKNLEQETRKTAVDDIRRAARTGGILKDADERARTQLLNLFHQLGFEQIEFRSSSAPLTGGPPG